MNKNFTVNSCCGTLELRTGSLICAYISLIWHLAIAIVYIISMVVSTSLPFDVTYALIIIGIDVGFICINIIFIVVVLVGLHQTKRGAMKAFIIYSYIFLAFCLIMFIIYASLGGGILNVMFKIVSLCITVFFLFIVRSYYLSFDDVKTAATPY